MKSNLIYTKRRFYFMAGILLAAVVAMFFVHVSTGFTYFSKTDLLRILLGGGTSEENLTVFDFRMVRSVLAVLVGGGLALSGAIFQTVSKNELASPGLLGVNAGAGLAVMLLLYLQQSNVGLALWEMPLASIVGASLAAMTIYLLSYRRNGRSSSTYILILNGISLSAGIHAVQLYYL